MVRVNNYGRHIRRESLEPSQFIRVYARKVETGRGAVVVEDEVNDSANTDRELDRFDLRDLLLDETD
jgi:hypothetical protein